MIVASATHTLLNVIHKRTDEHKLDNTTHVSGECGETNNESPSTRRENPISQQNGIADNVVNTIQAAMGSQDQRDKQTHL